MSTEPTVRNDYLNEVLVEQEQVEQELKRQSPPAAPAPPAPAGATGRWMGKGLLEFKKGLEEDEEAPPGAPSSRAIAYRVTGFWRWKTVVVPPNVYVVHTRRGHPEPITL